MSGSERNKDPKQAGEEVHKGGHMFIHMADSLCCTAEADTLRSNHTAIKNKYIIKRPKEKEVNKVFLLQET